MEKIIQAIQNKATGNTISCKTALDLAMELQVSAAMVGAELNNLGIKIKGCQLGCFK